MHILITNSSCLAHRTGAVCICVVINTPSCTYASVISTKIVGVKKLTQWFITMNELFMSYCLYFSSHVFSGWSSVIGEVITLSARLHALSPRRHCAVACVRQPIRRQVLAPVQWYAYFSWPANQGFFNACSGLKGHWTTVARNIGCTEAIPHTLENASIFSWG